MVLDEWERVVEGLEYAFQPIVNSWTGTCHGYEALLRGTDRAGFETIHAFFEQAYRDLALYRVDSLLRRKACVTFAAIPHHRNVKLFYNLDPRVLEMPDYSTGNTTDMLRELSISPSTLCFEISEQHEIRSYELTTQVLGQYRDQYYRIGLDDYGSGFSGLQLLYHCEPDFIKMDRFFIEGIGEDPRKRLFVSNVVNTAHLLGSTVIAEGVETEREFLACREIGCDFVQGYLVAAPTTDLGELVPTYEHIAELGRRLRRRRREHRTVLRSLAREVESVNLYGDMSQVLDALRRSEGVRAVIVVNDLDEPVGIVRERDVRPYLHSPYGWAVLTGAGKHTLLRESVSPVPIVDVSSPVESVVQAYSLNADFEEGVVLVDNGVYCGFLTAGDLLRAANEESVAVARDQNPLTHLPGNTLVAEHIDDCLESQDDAFCLVYFDFDNFKPFNDRYGFRRGDRAIQMFADILRAASTVDNFFCGHLGGDDFFAGFRVGERSFEDTERIIASIAEKFAGDVVSLYAPDDRRRGLMDGVGRDGIRREYPLLTVTSAALRLPVGRGHMTPDRVSAKLARLKSDAKRTPGCLLSATVDTTSRLESSHTLHR